MPVIVLSLLPFLFHPGDLARQDEGRDQHPSTNYAQYAGYDVHPGHGAASPLGP